MPTPTRAGVHLLTEGDEFSAECLERLQRSQQVRYAASEPVKLPDHYDIKPPLVCIRHKPSQVVGAYPSLLSCLRHRTRQLSANRLPRRTHVALPASNIEVVP